MTKSVDGAEMRSFGNVGGRTRPRARDDRLVVDRDGDLVGGLAGPARFARPDRTAAAALSVPAVRPVTAAAIAADQLRDPRDGAHHRVESLVDLAFGALRRGGIAGAEPPQFERAAADRDERRGDDAAREQPPPADMALTDVDGGHSSSRIPQR